MAKEASEAGMPIGETKKQVSSKQQRKTREKTEVIIQVDDGAAKARLDTPGLTLYTKSEAEQYILENGETGLTYEIVRVLAVKKIKEMRTKTFA